jgi:DNA-binding LacI/PurR family transcriptional regulator
VAYARRRFSCRPRIAGGPAFDGLFACSDRLAMTSINALRTAGRQAPDDIPVAGFDAVELARLLHPSLTTEHQSIDRAGISMIDALIRTVGGKEVAPIQLPTKLVVREASRPSSKPARRRKAR